MALDQEIIKTIQAADLVIGIGFDPVECDRPWFADVEVIALDEVSMVEGNYRPLEAIGDLATLLALLSARISGPKAWPAELLDRRRRAIQREPTSTSAGLSPLRVIEQMRSTLPRDAIMACDVGSHKLVLGQFWRTYEPGTFLVSNGLSGMGFGIPAGVAAQLVHPMKPVVAVVGDGGMLMMLHNGCDSRTQTAAHHRCFLGRQLEPDPPERRTPGLPAIRSGFSPARLRGPSANVRNRRATDHRHFGVARRRRTSAG